MMPQGDCPTPKELLGYSIGALPDDHRDRIGEHLEACPKCQAEIETISDSEDSLITILRLRPSESSEETYESEAACQEALDRICAIGRDPSFTTQLDAATGPADDVELGLLGHYRLLEKLGQGGMGAVYKALHLNLDKVVALKVLPSDRLRNAEAVARFKREMRAVGKLSHPNIVAAHDAGEIDGTHYLVMELVDGLDLSALVRQCGRLPVSEACELVRQAAMGLQHAHDHGMVHRDIKPSNLMLTPAGQVKILDMGLALLDDSRAQVDRELTTTGQLMGTIDYMAPEQGSDTHNVDIRADIYALGATLYKLLTGRAPFDDEEYDTPMKKLVALAMKEPAPVQELREDVPAEVAAIVQRCLAKEPQERFSTPVEVAEALALHAVDSDVVQFARTEIESTHAVFDESALAVTREHLSSDSVDTHSSGDHPASPRSKTDRHPAREQTKPRRRFTVRTSILATALIVAIAGAAVVIRIMTDKAELTIRSSDPNVEVIIKRNGTPVDELTLKRGDNTTSVYSGKIEVVIKGAKADNFILKNNRVTLQRGNTWVVDIQRKAVAEKAPDQPKGAKSAAKSRFALRPGEAIERDKWIDLLPVVQTMQGAWARTQNGFRSQRSDVLNEMVVPVSIEGSYEVHVEIDRSLDGDRFFLFGPVGSTVGGIVVGRRRASILGVANSEVEHVPLVRKETAVLVLKVVAQNDKVAITAKLNESPLIKWAGAVSDIKYPVAESDRGLRAKSWRAQPYRIGLASRRMPESVTAFRFRLIDGKARALTDGPSITPSALVAQPTRIPVARSWSIEAVHHRGVVHAVEYSPDGKWLATAGDDRIIRIWDTTGELSRMLMGHEGLVESLTWSADGRLLASAGRDDSVRIWDVETGRLIRFIVRTNSMSSISWPPKGQSLAFLNREQVSIWNRKTDAIEQLTDDTGKAVGDVTALAWSPTGTILATGGKDGTVRVWNMSKRTVQWAKNEQKAYISCLAWSPDGSVLASGTYGKPLMFFSRDTGALIHQTKASGSPYNDHGIAWSRDGKLVSWRGFQHFVIDQYPFRKGGEKESVSFADPKGCAWSSDNNTLLCVGSDQRGNIVKWDTKASQRRRRLSPYSYFLRSVSLSSDGRLLAVGRMAGAPAQIWDLDSGRLLYSLSAGENNGLVAWAPGRRVLAVNGGSGCELWNLDQGKRTAVLKQRENNGPIAWSPDGKWLITSHVEDDHGILNLWSVQSQQVVHRFEGLESPVYSVSWSHDSKHIAANGTPSDVFVWDVASRKIIHKFSWRYDRSIRWSPVSPKLLTRDVLWDASSKKATRLPGFRSPAWTANGRLITSRQAGSSTIRILNAETMKTVGLFERHAGAEITPMPTTWSPEGRLVSASDLTGDVWLWRVSDQQAEMVLLSLPDANHIVVSVAGNYRGSADVEKHIAYVVQTDSGQETLTPAEFAKRYGWKNDPERVGLGRADVESYQLDRRVAEWVTAQKGSVAVRQTNGATHSTSTASDLPPGQFRVYEIVLASGVAVPGTILQDIAKLPDLRAFTAADASITDAGMEWIGKSTNLRVLSIGQNPITNVGLAKLAGLKELTELSIYGTKVSDAGMVHLKKLPKLSRLHLSSVVGPLTDNGVEIIAELSELESLNLGATKLTLLGVQHLLKLKKLKWLHVPATDVGDEALRHMGKMKTLETLDIYETKITNGGLSHLTGLAILRGLRIGKNNLSDAALQHIQQLSNLESLDLEKTQVTDGGIEDLRGMTKLKQLNLRQTKISAMGVASLRKALPNCNVVWEPQRP